MWPSIKGGIYSCAAVAAFLRVTKDGDAARISVLPRSLEPWGWWVVCLCLF